MDIKLPNGKIIKGVPDGTPKDVIMEKAISAGLATAEDFGIQSKPQEPEKMTADEFADRYGDIPDIDNQIIPSDPKPERSIGEKIVGAGEAGLSAVTGMTTGTAGLIAGTFKGLIDEIRSGEFGSYEAADRIEKSAADLMQKLTYTPKGEAGQEYISDIGEAGAALAPLAGLSGPVQQAGQLGKAARPQIAQAAQVARQAAKPVAKTAKAVFQYQSPTKQKIAKMLIDRTPDVDTVGYKLKDGTAPNGGQLALTGSTQPTKTQKFLSKVDDLLGADNPKIEKDTIALNTIKQGFDEGVIASVKASSGADKIQMERMLTVMEKGLKNKEYAMSNRPSDVAGSSLMERVKAIRSTNRKAGQELEKAAQALKKVDVDSSPAIGQFMSDLDEMGIKLSTDKSGKIIPIFKGSDIEGLAAPESAIRRMVDRLAADKRPNAYELHRVKKYIDESVTYGKAGEGLSGKTERVLKKLRTNLDNILDRNFPEYDAANTKYADTIKVLDDIQDIAGRKIDLSAESADKAIGQTMRGIMSNNKSRVRLLDSIAEIDDIAAKYGATFDDNLMAQALFADELDRVFGAVARTSFQGQVEQAVKQAAGAAMSPSEAAVNVAAKAAQKAQGINKENAIKAMRRLLKEGQN